MDVRDPDRAAERALIVAYRGGDLEAFRHLYRRHVGRVLRVGLARGLGQAAAEDLVQSVFLRLHERCDQIDPDRALAPWLVTVALNLVRDSGRKAERQLTAREETPERFAQTPAEDPHSLTEGREAVTHARSAIAKLPEAQRDAVLAVRIGGLTYAEAATALSRSESAVRQNVHRGLRRLLQLLQDDESRGPGDPESDLRRSS